MIPAHITLEQINAHTPNTLMETLKIKYVSVGPDHLSAEMPVTPEVYQPMGILHGGASLALAETVGSAATHLIIDHRTHYAVGIELNANHVKSASEGKVIGTARPIHLGKRTHIWEIKITDEQGILISIARLTNMIIEKNA